MSDRAKQVKILQKELYTCNQTGEPMNYSQCLLRPNCRCQAYLQQCSKIEKLEDEDPDDGEMEEEYHRIVRKMVDALTPAEAELFKDFLVNEDDVFNDLVEALDIRGARLSG